MLGKNRLRSAEGCLTCKRRRKKCDENKPRCGACKRLELRCLWKGDEDVSAGDVAALYARLIELQSNHRAETATILNTGPDLSAFTDLVCGTYVLENCCDAFNLPIESVRSGNYGTTIRSTLSFAPIETSLAWGCIVAQGLLMIGNRYHDSRVMKAGIMKHVNILQGIGAAISDQEKRHDLDTIAAIDNLFIATATTSGFPEPGVSDAMSCHVVGLLSIIDSMKPEQFQEERALALLEYARFSKITVSLMLKHETALTSKPWRTIPWEATSRPKSSAQRLIDLLCEVAPLQAESTTTFPYSKPILEKDLRNIWRRVAELLSKLHDWRQSVEPSVKRTLVSDSAMTFDGRPSPAAIPGQNDAGTVELYELGLFNLLLIYLCGFLGRNQPLLRAVNAYACARMQPSVRDQSSQSLFSACVLPLDNLETRMRCAAAEILVISERVHHEGKDGLMLAYLVVPMRVARDFFAAIGDARSARFQKLFKDLSDFWSGRTW